MSKNSKKRRDAKVKTAKRMHTTLEQHQRHKSKLVPPLNRVPGPMTRTNWLSERVPEMLWACLVRAVLPRDEALQIFREVALIAKEFRELELQPHALLPTHTNLAALHPQLIPRIVQLVAKRPLGYAALRPLLAIESLPGREHWLAAVGSEADPMEFNTLADAIVEFYDHQSQESTDVRWLLMLFPILAHRLHFPAEMEERVTEVLDFPNRGDMRAVRPFIRAGEQSLWVMADSKQVTFEWSAQFWRECHHRTPCLLGDSEPTAEAQPQSQEFVPLVVSAITALSQHWFETATTTTIDAAHEGTFTFVLYALTCLLELSGANRTRITGRLLLRTLTECRITLAYLQKKNDPELWAKFRRYGAGQAKLAFLKLSEAEKAPHSISLEALERLANEDMWQEFVDIDLGQWAGADLRKMAEESDTKGVYDAHYGWTSGYAHGHWSAMRDATLTTCLNPLHRGHRVPSPQKRRQGDTLSDAVELVEAMITGLLKAYPGAEIILRDPAAASKEPPLGAPEFEARAANEPAHGIGASDA